MREKLIGGLLLVFLFALLAAAIAAIGNTGEIYASLLAAGLASLGHIRTWGWARCRPWPLVEGSFGRGLAPRAPFTEDDLQIEYTYCGETFARPAQTTGLVGDRVPIRVNPSDPSFSSLDLPPPRAWIAVYAISVTLLVATLVRAVATA